MKNVDEKFTIYSILLGGIIILFLLILMQSIHASTLIAARQIELSAINLKKRIIIRTEDLRKTKRKPLTPIES